MDQMGSIDAVFYMAGAFLTLAGVLGFPLKCWRKNGEPDPYDEENMDFPMSSEAEMIEQVKLAQVESVM